MMKAIFALVLILPVTGSAEVLPFEPAHASDQKRVTTESIMYEFSEFRAIADWNSKQHLLEIAKAKLAKAKSDLDRTNVLRNDKVITEKAIATAVSNYQSELSEVAQLEFDVNFTKGAATLYKYQLLEEGNPGTDYRKQISQLIAEGMKQEAETLKVRIDMAKTIQATAKEQYEIGKRMQVQHALSTSDLEFRKLMLDEATQQLESLENLREVAQKAFAAFSDNAAKI